MFVNVEMLKYRTVTRKASFTESIIEVSDYRGNRIWRGARGIWRDAVVAAKERYPVEQRRYPDVWINDAVKVARELRSAYDRRELERQNAVGKALRGLSAAASCFDN